MEDRTTGKNSWDVDKRRELTARASKLGDLMKGRQTDLATTGESSGEEYTGHVTDCKNSIEHFSRRWRWHDSSKEAFVEDGSLDIILDLLDLLQSSHSWSERSPGSKETEYAIIALLTKLSSCELARERVAQRGGVSMIMNSLGLLQSGFSFGLREGAGPLTESAAVCLLSYCFSESCQLQLLQTPRALSQLLRFRFVLRNQSLPAKLVFRLSTSLKSHKYLAELDLVNQLVSIVKSSVSGYKEERAELRDYWSDNSDSTIYHWTSHYTLLALSRLILLAPVTRVSLCSDHVEEVVDLMREYLEYKELPYTNKVSNSLFPLLEAVYAPRTKDIICSPLDHNVIQQFVFLTLGSDLAKAGPEEIADEMEYIICLQWYAPTADSGRKVTEFMDVLDQQITVMSQLKRNAKRMHDVNIEAPEYRLPSLQTISRIKLATGGYGLGTATKHIREILQLK